MIVKTKSANISYFKERYEGVKPELSGNKMIVRNETIYWYKSVDGYDRLFTDESEIDELINYLDSLPDLFCDNIKISGESKEIMLDGDRPLIALNEFVVEIKTCGLAFGVLGYRKLIR